MMWQVVLTVFLLVQGFSAKDDFLSHLTREICMDELGCFSAGSPFFDILERPLSLLPDDRDQIDTRFLLHTPDINRLEPVRLNRTVDRLTLSQAGFDPARRTAFVIPGYISRTAPEWKPPLVQSLLAAFDSNVFMVDWTSGDGPLYEQAVANSRVVGAEVALFIQKLQNATGIKPESIHLIGHSLGSHIAGYAGKRLSNLGRITALDPAGPYFTNVDPVVRLDRKDALFVDAIHSNAASSRLQGFGLTESIGHLDFYPNGGHLQPGCKDMGHAIWSFLQHPSFDAAGLADIQCNHKRAILLFIASIHSQCDLTADRCDSFDDFAAGKCRHCLEGTVSADCASLGMNADKYPRDQLLSDRSLDFYLNTSDAAPYCVRGSL